MSVLLYDSQKEALDKMKNGCILCGGVGSGKSITSLAYYWTKVCFGTISEHGHVSETMYPVPLYIITTAKKRDSLEWEEELSNFMLSTNPKCSYMSTKVIVDSWNNLHKYTDVERSFFIFDEQKVVGYGAWVKSFLTITKSNNWILLSATPGDVWMDYVPVFIANGFYKNKTHFVREHVIYKPYMRYPVIDRYVNIDKLERLKKSILVHMNRENIITRHTKIIYCDFDKEKIKNIKKTRWDPFDNEPIKNASEMWALMRRVVNSDESRLDEIINLLELHDKIIIFYNFDYELEILRKLSDYIEVAELNGHRHEGIPYSDRWVYLVQYNAGAEAWNCIDTNVIVFYSLNYSYKMTEQAQGRIDRTNSPFNELQYYFLTSRSIVDHVIFKSLLSKEEFNEKRYLSTIKLY